MYIPRYLAELPYGLSVVHMKYNLYLLTFLPGQQSKRLWLRGRSSHLVHTGGA